VSKQIGSWVVACLAGAVLFLPATPLEAQDYFGMNQVQYEKFTWMVKETDHFHIHYYPEEEIAVHDAAQMAERAYGRLSALIGHQFRERKPIVLFASRAHFGQNLVTGDLGEGTGGVTEGLRHRVLMPFTGDYQSFEQVLAHELVHSFQYDIFARGRAGGGLQTLQAVNPPLWFMEGMAEYLSKGPGDPHTAAVMRDAALNGNLPTIEQMTMRPDLYFPYRFGEALFEYIGKKWGDEVIGQLLLAAPNVGIERAFRRELGISLEDLSDEWREAMQNQHLPQIAQLERPRSFSQPLLTERRTGGQIFLAPALSHDGKHIAFLSNGSFARGEIFIDLWLGNAETGKRIKRLVESTVDPDFEELRLLYSQSSFSPDGKLLAFTAQRAGRDVLYLLDVERRRTTFRFDLPVDAVTGPSFSPDSRRIVFSGNTGGHSDLYIVDVDGENLRRLTHDRYAALQPQWSPDGKAIAFATDRGPGTDLNLLQFNPWQIALLHLETNQIEVLPGQDGLNLNPMWAPDGRSIAFISDRTGIANVFLYELDEREHYQLTNVVGYVGAFTSYSPAITWARGADRIAYTYYEDNDYTVWGIDRPRQLKRSPYRPPTLAEAQAAPEGSRLSTQYGTPALAAQAADDDTVQVTGRRSLYRSPTGVRESAVLPAAERGNAPVTVAALLDSAAFALPDTLRFRDYRYKGTLLPEYIGRPTIGYAQDNFGRGVYGGTQLIMSDMLGNHRLSVAGSLNGRLSEAEFYTAYASLGQRLQWMAGGIQQPYFLYSGEQIIDIGGGIGVQQQQITRYVARQAFGIAQYPLNRFTRFEAGLSYNHVDRATLTISRQVSLVDGRAGEFYLDGIQNQPGLSYVQPMAAYVSDNTLFGYTGPVMGRRYRFQIQPTLGQFQWMEYLADYRRYDPIIFNFLTVATRFSTRLAVGRDETQMPSYIGRPELLRGYNRESFDAGCFDPGGAFSDSCGAARLIGSRVALVNAELRFPLVRTFNLGIIPIGLPPIDGLVFYDAGVAWSAGQSVDFMRPADGDASVRFPLRSYGFGLRVNLFNMALARWDYSIPLDIDRKGFWTFSLGPSF
jgi:Tol biopolymer transport system component